MTNSRETICQQCNQQPIDEPLSLEAFKERCLQAQSNTDHQNFRSWHKSLVNGGNCALKQVVTMDEGSVDN